MKNTGTRRFPAMISLILSVSLLLPAAVPAQDLSGPVMSADTVDYSSGSGLFSREDRQKGDDAPEPATRIPGQTTVEDLEEMNHGDLAMLFSKDGYLTFLRGRYSDQIIEDYEDGIRSLFGMESLLGLSKGSEFFCVYAERNRFGYTYYTYKQRYGDLTIQNAVLKIIVDPEGYGAGLACSFTPNIGIAPENETKITPEEAIEIVKQQYPSLDFRFYPEDTGETSYTDINDIAYHCWAIFTNIPEGEAVLSGERRYLEHLVTYDGYYLGYLAVVSTKELQQGDNVQEGAALAWFDGKEADTYTGTVTLHDGTIKELTVPVVYDPETRLYYLADLERHILVSDCYQYITSMKYQPFTSEDNTGWPEHYLIAYDSYIRVYDFYDSFGMHSVDGFGMPLLILSDYCDENGYPVDNAGFLGFLNGWSLFGASGVNDFSECLDVIGHEYTHAVTNYIRGGDIYQNESGALNEATSDIMGNLCEMILGDTQDTEWLIAENSGEAIRSMSFPWLYRQPVTVGGQFYYSMEKEPSIFNDLGGVHTNSSLVNHVAWQLWSEGLSLEDEYYLWREAMNLLTPQSGFREIHQALLFAAEIRQMDVKWLGLIDMLCEQAGY
ncbi:MAG: M4 family metallopeptidase [Parasporobacterium sp.]|nr:M4 family metallopeptidase [Parasporobacterium sp.]